MQKGSTIKVLLYLSLGALIIGIVFWQILEFQKRQITPSPQKSSEIWKIFTSNQKDFSFKYPASLFIKTIYTGHQSDFEDSEAWTNNSSISTPQEMGLNDVWMYTVVGQKPLPSLYQEFKQLKTNPSFTESDTLSSSSSTRIDTKIADLTTNNFEGMYYHEKVSLYNNQSQLPQISYSYVAVWLKNGIQYTLVLYARNEQILNKYQKTFEQIVSTVVFP